MKKWTRSRRSAVVKFALSSLITVFVVVGFITVYRENAWETTKIVDATISEVFAMGLVLLFLYKIVNWK